jgi:hypothetical protein
MPQLINTGKRLGPKRDCHRTIEQLAVTSAMAEKFKKVFVNEFVCVDSLRHAYSRA